MQARYDPISGLTISLPVYESEMSIKLIQAIIKELKKADQATNDFAEIIATIHLHPVRKQ